MGDSSDYRIIAREGKAEYEGRLKAQPVKVGDAEFGGPVPTVIAGPCAVESREQTLSIARAVKAAGADCLRGGAYKPRTSPYSFQGLGREGLEILAEAREETGLPVVTEVMDVRLVDEVSSFADVLQVGSRNMQNFPLLLEVGRTKKPVLLKRGMSASLKEWLCAAEYIALGGNQNIIICERGVRCSVSRDYARNTLDMNVILPARKTCVLPVIVDPSHSTGDPDLVAAASKAAVAAGAQGLIIEVIDEDTRRGDVLCDGHQSIRPSVLREIVSEIKGVATLV
ncbi:MAG: 3-deoxy-7-phosphoheptulonate synthase [Planctomycetota bacterium]